MAPLKTVFGCDLRSLALVRVWLGAILIADLVIRAGSFSAHYTDAGAVPRSALFLLWDTVPASLHMISGSAWITGLLFMLSGAVALALMFGYRSRLAAFLSWLLFISLDSRNQFVSQGGDQLLRALMFWLMFLPIGARFSIDAALDKSPPIPNAYFSIASLGLLVQAMCVYFFTALLKSDPVWLKEGTAVYYALANDSLVLPLGEWLRNYPPLMSALTYFVWCLEIMAALLMFSPVLHIPLRLLGLFLLISMHIGFSLCLDIGLFPFISIASLLAFTPATVWDWLWGKLHDPAADGIEIYYDKDCVFCEKVVLILRSFLLLPGAQIAPAQSRDEVHALMQTHNSWVVYNNRGEHYLRWPALAWLVSRSPLFAPVGKLLSAQWLAPAGEHFYQWVADSRGRFSRASRLLLPFRQLHHSPSTLAQCVFAFLVVVVLWSNIGTLKLDGVVVPSAIRTVSASLRLSQTWNMFAPAPSKTTGWFVALGETKDGRPADVYRNQLERPNWSRDTYLELNYDAYRWRKYLTRLPLEKHAERRPYYLQYLCRQWNQVHGGEERLNWIKLYFVAERTPLPGNSRHSKRLLLWKSDCGQNPVQEIIDLRRGVLPDLS